MGAKTAVAFSNKISSTVISTDLFSGLTQRILHLALLLVVCLLLPLHSVAAIYDPSPADNDTLLIADTHGDNTCDDQARCIPLILIHGITGNFNDAYGTDDISTPNRVYFEKLLNNLHANGIADKYKIYRFHYVSNKYSVEKIARSLRNRIDDFTDKGKISKNKIVIVAHSMGGLVARAYMNEWHLSPLAPDFQNRPAGERVYNLITLATPHHGSPVSNLLPRFSAVWDPNWYQWSFIDDALYWSLKNKCLNCLSPSNPNRSDLRWDNYDSLWRDTFYTDLLTERNDWLRGLNNLPLYDNKIIAYYGWLGTNSEIQTIGAKSALSFHAYFTDVVKLHPDDTKMFQASGVFMERIFKPYNEAYPEYAHEEVHITDVYNDGVVPVQSAYFKVTTQVN